MADNLWRALKAEIDEPGAVTKSELRALLRRFPEADPTPPTPEPTPEPIPPAPEPTHEPSDPEPAPTPTGFRRTLDDVVYDSYGPPLRTDGKFAGWGRHEGGNLGGVQSHWDWAHGGRPGIRPPYPNGIYDHMNTWGQATPEDWDGMAETRVRCQVDAPAVYFLLSANGPWTVGKAASAAGAMEGGYWSTASFVRGPAWQSPAQFRSEPGGHSFDLSQSVNADGTPKAYPIAHWFYKGFWHRLRIPAGAQVAIVTRMRLISDVPGVDVNQARFVGCFSGDLFDAYDTVIGENGRNPAFSIQRHKRLTGEWKSFTMVTGTEAQIRSYPAMPFLTV